MLEYKALSYAWGLPSRNDPTVLVNDCPVTVTINLEQALKYERSPDKYVILWVDALCIDQKNNYERTFQVSQMGRIYSKATEVVVFLGHGLGERKTTCSRTKQLDQHSRWWDRIWVVQEAVLAKAITIRFGNASAPWELLADVAGVCSQHRIYPKLQHVSASDIKVLSLLSKATDIDVLRQTWRQNEKPSLLFVLRKFSNRQASDERDKIYALLGLCNSDIPITPDYSRTITEAYRKTTIDIIRTSNTLDVLSGDVGRKNRQDLPSWVPDWSATFGDHDRERVPFLSQYNACGEVGSTHADGPPSPQTKQQLTLLAESLVYRPEAFLPYCFSRAIQDYGRKYQTCGDICARLMKRCDPEGHHAPATFTTSSYIKDKPLIPQKRFNNHDLSTEPMGARETVIWDDKPWQGCLRMRGKYIAVVAHSFNPVYTSSSMESVSDTIMDWLKNALRYFEDQTTEQIMKEFVTTLLSSIKKTPNGFERLKDQDQPAILEWFYARIEGRKISEGRFTAMELDAFTDVFKLSVTMRTFFITDDGRMGLGPTSTTKGDILPLVWSATVSYTAL
ncbi:hypothetical protein FAVG1_07864 [Fusarium avenaceum]|nr:hypothetical protein FAVG1_07864 [Fusarium avenaceum]